MTVTWLAQPTCCGGQNRFEIDQEKLARQLMIGVDLRLRTCVFHPNPAARPPKPGELSFHDWRAAKPSMARNYDRDYQATSVHVADGYPKMVRMTADGPALQHYALVLDVGCRSVWHLRPRCTI